MNSARLIGFEKLPQEILERLDGITELWKRQLGARLIGLYLHGSIALCAFRPESGDLDLAAVVRDSLRGRKARSCMGNHRAGWKKLPDRDFSRDAAQRAELEKPRQPRVSLQRVLKSNVLILGRILSSKIKMEKKILFKYEAGLWMMRNLPPEFTE